MHFQNKQLDTTKVSSIFYQLGQKKPEGFTKISELIVDFHENGLVLTMLFFAVPVAIPLPYPPGFTTLMGLPLIILSIQMLLGFRQIFLPARINNYQISNTTLINISKKMVPLIRRVEKYLTPRFNFANSIYCEQFIGLVSLLCSIAVAVPLPLTNAIPACGIVIMTLGLLNRDGLIILLGFFTSIIGLVVASVAITASWLSIKYLFHLFF
ncbi:exopolysaccharide biosynthesis protein [Candidatus Tisiphia endosymbiont of Nemotelus uliginosus]|uniref:exopolysaccharide biosynthesis protein n=1 Tax=Candidatus Tisiphia endosymbiont of Nemotelus uliginosus TaxID=3077926 RepID=UPI0035C8DBD0